MENNSQPTHSSASIIAPATVATGAKGAGMLRAAGSAATQYENVPRKIPSVHCVPRSRTKLIRMRGENCIDASVSVINSIAKTIDTTVMIYVAMTLRMAWATWGSSREGNKVTDIQAAVIVCNSSAAD